MPKRINKKNNDNIVILGCGLSGMITALSLAEQNIPTTIIEKQALSEDALFNDIRTTALNDNSKKFFEKINIWPFLKNQIGLINDIYVVDNKSEQMIHFSNSDLLHGKKIGYLIENISFKKTLYNLVKNNSKITILDKSSYKNIENKNTKCTILLVNNEGEKKINTRLIIACDGNNSLVKKLYFSHDIEENYQQKALTFITEHEKLHEGSAIEHFMSTGPFAILPLKNQKKSSIVWTLPIEKAELIMKLEKNEVNYLVQENFGEFLGKIKIISDIASFPLKANATKKYFNKSILLIADTAHIIHPLAGQGLNQGIKDIECLSGLIHKNDISTNTLTIYEKERKKDNEAMLLITDGINKIFQSDSKILHGLRQIGFKAIDDVKFIKKQIIKYASG